MASIISENDTTVEDLNKQVEEMQKKYDELKAQLDSYPTAEQARQINNYMDYYRNSISKYQDAIANLEKSRQSRLRWSAINEQAMKWYVQWFASHRWATWAELAKSVADINAQWASERAQINSEADVNLVNAYWNLANLMQNAWAAASTWLSSTWSWSSWYGSSWWRNYSYTKPTTNNEADMDNLYSALTEWLKTSWVDLSAYKPFKKLQQINKKIPQVWIKAIDKVVNNMDSFIDSYNTDLKSIWASSEQWKKFLIK